MIKEEVLKTFAKKNVLVTGGTGLIGRQVVDILSGTGAYIRSASLDRIKINNSVEYIFCDLTEFKACRDITHGMDYVFHLAGIKGSAEVTGTKLASHFVPTLMMNTNMLEACRLNYVKKVVYTSSIGAYSNAEIMKECDYRIDSIPMDFAGWAKRIAELQIHAYKVQYNTDNFAIVRPSNVYGPGDDFNPKNAMVIPSLIYRIYTKENPVVVQGDGSSIRDFVYSKDAAEGIILALFHGTNGGFVNLGGGRGYSIKELLETLSSFLDFNYRFEPTKQFGYSKRVMDISLPGRLIDYNPTTTLSDGLKQTWEWFVNNHNEYRKRKDWFNEEG